MIHDRHTLRSAWLALLVVLAPVVGAVPAAAATMPPAGPQEFAVYQNGECTTITAIGDGSQSVNDYYDYRTPYNTQPNDYTYASHGTADEQANQVSNLYVYEGAAGYSLVVLHDELSEPRSGAPNGSTVTMEFSGLPEAGSWVVQDDSYPGRDDNWDTTDTTSEIDWMWNSGRTDGGAYLGIGQMGSEPLTVTPGFNQDADQWDSWNTESDDAAEMTEWRLLSGDGTQESLDMSQSVDIYRGSCAAVSVDSPSAALDMPALAEPGENVTLDASGSTANDSVASYEWDFDGDGTPDETTESPTVEHVFDEGYHTVAVTAVDSEDNRDTAYADITVSSEGDDEAPTAALSGPELIDQDARTVFDASNSTDDYAVTSYEWDFDGDGTPDDTTETALAYYTYTENGTYDVTVTAFDAHGQTDSATTTVTVEDTVPPNANADGPETAEVNQTVTYAGNDSFDTASNLTYTWAFGDGTNATGATVEHTFTEAGTYNVTLTVTDEGNNTDQDSVQTRVSGEPDAPVNASLSAPESATVGENVTLDASGSTGNITEYRFDANGDGEFEEETENSTFTWQYEDAGTYNATVVVGDADGNESTANATITVTDPGAPNATLANPGEVELGYDVTLDASASTAGDNITEYQWDLDGDEVTTENATVTTSFPATGNYTVGVTVVDEDGDTASDEVTFEVVDSVAPWPDIDGPNVVGVDQTFDVDAEDAVDNGAIESYEWSFGDNTTETGIDPVHVYEEPGNYTLTLTVTDAAGNDRDYSEQVTVRNESVDDIDEPTALFEIPDTVSMGDSVELDASESYDDEGDGELTDTYQWDLDGDYDVDVTTNETTNRTLDEPGRYPVILWVTDETGNTDMWLEVVTVTDDTEPSAEFDAPDDITAGESATFDASASSDPAGIASYSWTFGDGGSATGETASHTFDSAGDYEVTLTVTDEAGNTATATQTVSVAEPEDQADPSPSPSPGGSGGSSGSSSSVEFTDLSVSQNTVAVGDPVRVSVAMENTGSSASSKLVSLSAGNYSEERFMRVDGGSSMTVTFEPTFDQPGNYTLTVGSMSTQVSVVETGAEFTVTDTRVRTQDVSVGDSAIIEATVANDGGVAGNHTLNLTMADGSVLSETVTVPAGDEVTVTFTPTVEEAGEHTVTIGDQSLTFTVGQQGTSTTSTATSTSTSTSTGDGGDGGDGGDDGSDTGTPGFGLAVALVALLAAALLAVRDD